MYSSQHFDAWRFIVSVVKTDLKFLISMLYCIVDEGNDGAVIWEDCKGALKHMWYVNDTPGD